MINNDLIIPWEEKRKEYENISGNEQLLANTWDLGEDLVFFFLMYMATL